MTGETVLIAAFSARALAASARRAGYKPLIVDCFGDDDTVALAEAARCLPARVQVGFTARPLIAALESLVADAPSPPIGLVLGAGFECNPRLVAKLADRFQLIGNDAETIRQTKDPRHFFKVLDDLGVPHPETRLDAPEQSQGWLMKRIGGSGGLHIHNCPTTPRPDPRRYFQRRATGDSISLMGLVSEQSAAFAASRQWTNPLSRRPFRYGGASGSLPLDEDLEARLIEMSLAVSEALSLRGIVSFDYLVQDGEPLLLEVNPRPGATLDVFDDASGTLFKAHVEASRGGDPASLLASDWHPPVARAAAFLYADRGSLSVPAIQWPDWAADRPRAASTIGAGQPLATVIAEGLSVDEVQAACVQRLGALEILLYDHSNKKRSSPMSSTPGFSPSVNARAGILVDALAANAQALRCSVTTGEAGERCIDLGSKVPGGLEAGRRLGEICMGGLGTVTLTSSSGLDRWPLGVIVHSSNPVVACLGSQYAGWTITDDSGFFALGSGPARALSRVEELYKELGYADQHNKGALVIEGDATPPPAVATKVATACGIKPADLTVLYAPTGSLAGTVQIAARVLEVALHKAHSLHFDLNNIVDGYGVAPIAPPIPDFVKAMGRTNDAIIYGGRIQLFVRGSDDAAKDLAEKLPSNTCSIYGAPFAEIFASVNGDFYKIDASLFSPAVVTVSNLDTGSSFHAGKLAPDIVDASFK